VLVYQEVASSEDEDSRDENDPLDLWPHET